MCGGALNSRHSKCLVAVGLDASGAAAIAYYCVPGDVAQFVSEYRGLPYTASFQQYAKQYQMPKHAVLILVKL